MPETIHDLMPETPDLNAERLAALKALMPDIFTDEGKINETELRKIVEEVPGNERYEFKWFGKTKAKHEAFTPTRLTLNYDDARSINPDESENIIIEGENLEVLKLLLCGYREQIKCIYIDPPYNTGKDFVYSDKYATAYLEYLENIGARKDGIKIDANPETSGRFHSSWLSMMYSRLLIARQFLTDDGLIFISIDDNELHNLRKLCDEVFNAENFVNLVTVETKVAAGASGGGEDKRLKKNAENLLIFAKNYDLIDGFASSYTEEPLFDVIQRMKDEDESWKYTSVLIDKGTQKKLTTITDGEGNPIEIYRRDGIVRTTIRAIAQEEDISAEEVYTKYFDGVFSDTNAQTSIRTRVIDSTGPLQADEMYEVVYTPRSGKDKGKSVSHYYVSNTVRRVIWLSDVAYERDGQLIKKERTGTIWDQFNYNNVGREGGISFPSGKKPIDLIKTCISLVSKAPQDVFVLDFFAGSGSTGHATLEMNEDDGCRRRYILVQLPEAIDQDDDLYAAGYRILSEATIARNKNVVEQINEFRRNAHPKLFGANPDEIKPGKNPEVGFKVFTLEKSYFPRTEWTPEPEMTEEEKVTSLRTYIDEKEKQLKIDFVRDKLLTEVLIKEGFKLTYKVEKIAEFTDNEVLKVTDGEKEAVVCLDETLNDATVEQLRKLIDNKVVVIERALDTTKKWNLHNSLGEKFRSF